MTVLTDESGATLRDESSDALDQNALSTSVSLDAGTYSLSGLALTVSADVSVTVDAGSYTLSGLALDITIPDTTALQDEGGDSLLDDGGLALNDESTLGTSVSLNTGAFSVTGYDFTTTLGGPIDIPLDAGAFNLSGPLLGIGSGLGGLDGTLNTVPDPDEIDYVPENPFAGTVYWVVTASATPPALQGTPAGFASSGRANGSFSVTTSGGTSTIDLSSVSGGNYYIHVVGQRSSDGAFTRPDSDAIVIDGDLEAGSFAIIGYSIGISRLVRADAGVFALTGYDVGINDSRVTLDAGSLSITGFDLGVVPAVPLGAGSFSLSGHALTASRLVGLDDGTFSLTGLGLVASGSIEEVLDTGSFSLSGHDTVVAANFNSALNAGSFSLTGRSLTIVEGAPIVLDAGSFLISGYGVTASILSLADPNIALPQDSLRGGVLVSSKRSGFVNNSERGGVLENSTRGGVVKRGT